MFWGEHGEWDYLYANQIKAPWTNGNPDRHPAWTVATHEVGHLMDFLTQWRASREMPHMLMEAYTEKYGAEFVKPPKEKDYGGKTNKWVKDYGDYMAKRDKQLQEEFLPWLWRQQSAYSFHSDGTINHKEMLAEAVSDFENNGFNASEASKLIHNHLIKEMDRRLAPAPRRRTAP